jgi:hypothetical protein
MGATTSSQGGISQDTQDWGCKNMRLDCCMHTNENSHMPGKVQRAHRGSGQKETHEKIHEEKKQSHIRHPSPLRNSKSLDLNRTKSLDLNSKTRQPLSPTRSVPYASAASPKSTPVWKQDPPPMLGWTSKEQKIVLAELEDNPLARKNPDHLQHLIEKTHRLLPHKSIDEIEKCFHYVDNKRIAFFGSSEKPRKH